MDIELKSKVLLVVEIKKPTNAKMFKDLLPGQTIQLSITTKYAGSGPNGSTHASYITIENLTSNETTLASFNTISRRLEHFVLKEI